MSHLMILICRSFLSTNLEAKLDYLRLILRPEREISRESQRLSYSQRQEVRTLENKGFPVYDGLAYHHVVAQSEVTGDF